MAQVPPITDEDIDEVIKSNVPYLPSLAKTQGYKLRELVKWLRDRLEQEINDNYEQLDLAVKEKVDKSELYDTNGLIKSDQLPTDLLKKTGDSMSGTLQLAAGTSSSAPLKFPEGGLTTTPQDGALERGNDGELYFTKGTERKKIGDGGESPDLEHVTAKGNTTNRGINVTGSENVWAGINLHAPIFSGKKEFRLEALRQIIGDDGLFLEGGLYFGLGSSGDVYLKASDWDITGEGLQGEGGSLKLIRGVEGGHRAEFNGSVKAMDAEEDDHLVTKRQLDNATGSGGSTEIDMFSAQTGIGAGPIKVFKLNEGANVKEVLIYWTEGDNLRFSVRNNNSGTVTQIYAESTIRHRYGGGDDIYAQNHPIGNTGNPPYTFNNVYNIHEVDTDHITGIGTYVDAFFRFTFHDEGDDFECFLHIEAAEPYSGNLSSWSLKTTFKKTKTTPNQS